MTQQTMFDDFDRQRMVQPDRPIKPPHNGTETSKAAAEAIALISGDQRRKVYDFIKSRGEEGATRKEIERGVGITTQSACPRMDELKRDGLIVKVGETREGCQAWRAV